MAFGVAQSNDQKLRDVEANIAQALDISGRARTELKDSWSFSKVVFSNDNENLFLIQLKGSILNVIGYLHYVNRYVLPVLRAIDYKGLDKAEKKGIKDRVKAIVQGIRKINDNIQDIILDKYIFTRDEVLHKKNKKTEHAFVLFSPEGPFLLDRFKKEEDRVKSTDFPYLTKLTDLYRVIEEHCILTRDHIDLRGRIAEVVQLRDFLKDPSGYGPLGELWQKEIISALYSHAASKYLNPQEINEIAFWDKNNTIKTETYTKLVQFIRTIALPDPVFDELDKETKLAKISNAFREIYLDGTFYYISLTEKAMKLAEEKLKKAVKEFGLVTKDWRPIRLGRREEKYRRIYSKT